MKRMAWGVAALATMGAMQAHADAREDVHAAFEKAMAKSSYVANSVTDAGGRTVESRIEVQLPSSFHMKNADAEIIVVPGGSWMNQGGQWMKLPMDMSAMLKNATLAAMTEGAKLVKDVSETGTETVEGCEATNYAYKTEGRIMGVNVAAKVQLSVCNDSGLPVRVISEDLKGQGRTTVVYDYDAAVDIRAPG
jgi:hypothetical protein